MNQTARPATSTELVRRNIRLAFQQAGVDIRELARDDGELRFMEVVAVALLLGCSPAQFFNWETSDTPSGTPRVSEAE